MSDAETRLAALERRVEELEDLNAIRRLQMAYGYYIDYNRPEEVAGLFAEDGVLELPFLHSLGIPTRHQGREAIANLYDFVGGNLYPGFSFTPENIKVLINTKDQVFAEYLSHTRAASTGRRGRVGEAVAVEVADAARCHRHALRELAGSERECAIR